LTKTTKAEWAAECRAEWAEWEWECNPILDFRFWILDLSNFQIPNFKKGFAQIWVKPFFFRKFQDSCKVAKIHKKSNKLQFGADTRQRQTKVYRTFSLRFFKFMTLQEPLENCPTFKKFVCFGGIL
jgi:hypothetical protein